MLSILLLIVGLAAGGAGGFVVRQELAKRKTESFEAKAESVLNDAKNKQKEILFQAKEKAISIIEQAKRDEMARQNELRRLRERLEKRESLFDQKLLNIESKQQKIYDKAKQIEDLKQKINNLKEEQEKKLLEVANLNREQAKDLVLKQIEESAKDQLVSRIKKLDYEASEELDKKAKSKRASC